MESSGLYLEPRLKDWSLVLRGQFKTAFDGAMIVNWKEIRAGLDLSDDDR